MSIFTEIEFAIKEIGHGWTTPNKGRILASAVIALRPKISMEVGVWAGKGLISLALAHKHIGSGMVYGIDPYSADASAEGQTNPEDEKWWSGVDHDAMFNTANENILKFGCQNVAQIVRKKSSEYEPQKGIGILSIDGNHGEEAVSDVNRYAPCVQRGGLVFADDLGWAGGSVGRSVEALLKLGFAELYRIENSEENFGVFQRIK